MAGRWKNDLTWDDVTPKAAFMNRRQLMAGVGAIAAGGIAGPALAKLGAKPSKWSTDETPNSLEDITSYNNFYEFGTGKEDPARYASKLTINPWSITIDGMVDNPGEYSMDQIMEGVELEERIYRLKEEDLGIVLRSLPKLTSLPPRPDAMIEALIERLPTMRAPYHFEGAMEFIGALPVSSELVNLVAR